MLQALKNLNLDKVLDMDEAISLSAYARWIEGEYEALDMAVPDWLGKATETLRQEIARRTHASDAAEMKRIEAELEGYKTVGEKKNDAQRRLASLQKKLGLAATASR